MGKELWNRPAPGLPAGSARNEKWGRWQLNHDELKPGLFITIPQKPYRYDVAFKWLRTPEGRVQWFKNLIDNPNLTLQDVDDFKQALQDLEKWGEI